MTRKYLLLPTTFAAALLACVAWIMLACGSKGSGRSIASYADLKPDQLTMKDCNLELAGSKFRAEIRQTKQNDTILVELLSLNAQLDSERYRSTDQEFDIIEAGLERYDPPIPLIKYGMHVGDEWDWKGELWTGPQKHAVTAKVTTSSESMMIKGGSVPNVVRIEVVLSIDSGRPDQPATRKMKFWIAPDMGVVKRAFGDFSTREPLER